MRVRIAGLLGAGILLAVLTSPLWAASAPAPAAPVPPAQETDILRQWIFPVFDYFVLSLLALASIAGIALSIHAMLHIRESRIAPVRSTERIRKLIDDKDYKELMDFTATDPSFVSRAVYAGIRRAHLKYAAMREGMESAVGEQTSDMFRRIEPLNVIGNIGPLLGLLGTVLGMIMAFYEMRAAHGNADVEHLSMGISTALWHTFFGLFVAIPCLVVYGFYRTKADKIATRAALVAEELLESLRPDPSEEKAERKKRTPREAQPAETEAS